MEQIIDAPVPQIQETVGSPNPRIQERIVEAEKAPEVQVAQRTILNLQGHCSNTMNENGLKSHCVSMRKTLIDEKHDEFEAEHGEGSTRHVADPSCKRKFSHHLFLHQARTSSTSRENSVKDDHDRPREPKK